MSSSYRAGHNTSVASSDEVVSLPSSAVELNVRDSDVCPSLPVDAPRNVSFMVKGRIDNAPTSMIIRPRHNTSVASPDMSLPLVSSAVELKAGDLVERLSLSSEKGSWNGKNMILTAVNESQGVCKNDAVGYTHLASSNTAVVQRGSGFAQKFRLSV
ncbi:hypothetical protein K439DRAFT_1619597 [Ramaria rubella]|nr:hypothetical protein K439DRAFT_1619597 [Ramaria rubella]